MNKEEVFPKTNLVILFSPTIRSEALAWFVEKVTETGLLIQFEPPTSHPAQTVRLHVTADFDKFISAAQAFGIRKPVQGRLRSLTTGTIDDFLCDGIGPEGLLSSADKQFLVVQELQRMRSVPEEGIPGYPLLFLPNEAPLFEFCLENKLILDYFPLHDERELSEFEDYWIYSVIAGQPFDQIRQYFGDGMSMYFSFLEFYMRLLLLPSLYGIYQFFLGEKTRKDVIFGCLFNVIWVVLLGQDVWRRKCQNLSISWNTFSEWHLVEPNFRSAAAESGSLVWENTKKWLKINVLSAGAIMIIIGIAACILFGSLWLQTYLEDSYILSSLWIIADALIIAGIGHGHAKVAVILTKWENHRQQADFEYYRVWRLIQFETVHNFLPLLYIGFWIQDLNLLQGKVNYMLLIVPITSAIKETVFPLLCYKHLMRFRSYLIQKWPGVFCWLLCDNPPPEARSSQNFQNPLENWPEAGTPLRILEKDDPRIVAAEEQQEKSPYNSTFDDYLELYIQYGYVFLFAGISPFAALLAFLNNVFEIRTDAYKLCKVNRRLFVKGTRDIGPWITGFEILGVLAIFINCAMLSVHSFDKIGFPPLTFSTAISGSLLLLICKLCLYFFPDPSIDP